MCTYNGEMYIREQLQSIIDNTVKNWKLYVFDDQSYDNTIKIIQEFQNKYPDKIFIKINQTKKGAITNFLSSIYEIGMVMNDEDFIMLCDQDDIWYQNKIKITLASMKKMVRLYGNEKPLLVCSDVTVVDNNLNIIHNSFRQMNHYNVSKLDFPHLMMENKVQGCTTMFNKSMAVLLDRLPSKATMYDGWLALIASVFGKIQYLEVQTMMYRQHTDNVQGSIAYKDDVKNKLFHLDRQKQIVMNTTGQIKEFLQIYGAKIPLKDRKAGKAFATLSQQNFILRRYHIMRYHMWKSGILRNIGILILI